MRIAIIIFSLFCFVNGNAQIPSGVKSAFPQSTIFHQNIAYGNDTLKKHLLDIYLPANAMVNTPLVIWIHGGAWMVNDKYADMSYMTNTIHSIIDKGYALASIDYRHSTTAPFPAQIQDCSAAVQYLYDHASAYKLDKNRIALMGFSAGGHLASLLALSVNNNVSSFYPDGKKPSFKVKAVCDFYGPSNLLMFYSKSTPENVSDPIARLLGVSPLVRPDLAMQASPVTYVDKDDPAFFIVNGEKDPDVAPAQSYLLKAYLDLAHVKNELTIVKDAPHYGIMFDADDVRLKLLKFLERELK